MTHYPLLVTNPINMSNNLTGVSSLSKKMVLVYTHDKNERVNHNSILFTVTNPRE